MVGSVNFFRKLIKGILFFVFPLTLASLIVLTTIFFIQASRYEEHIQELEAKIVMLESALLAETEISSSEESSDGSSSGMESTNIISSHSEISEPVSAVSSQAVSEISEPELEISMEISEEMSNDIILLDNDYAPLEYPDMIFDLQQKSPVKAGTAYLTFDDGPSVNTDTILDILAEYDIKAAFFVINKKINGYEDILNRIVDEGHSLGMHTASHKFDEIYSSFDAFMNDLYSNFRYIYEATGIRPNMMRFAGGSVNGFNYAIRDEIISEITSRGIVYYDWNNSTDDSVLPLPNANKITRNVLNNIKGKERLIILAHDTASKTETVKALPDIIEGVKKAGFKFEKLTPDVAVMKLPDKK